MISHNVVSRAHVSTTVMFYFEVYCIRVVFKRLKKKKKGSRENQNTNDPQHSSRGPRTVRNSGYAERKKKKRKLKPRFFFVLVFLFLSACMRAEFPSLHFFFFFFLDSLSSLLACEPNLLICISFFFFLQPRQELTWSPLPPSLSRSASRHCAPCARLSRSRLPAASLRFSPCCRSS